MYMYSYIYGFTATEDNSVFQLRKYIRIASNTFVAGIFYAACSRLKTFFFFDADISKVQQYLDTGILNL